MVSDAQKIAALKKELAKYSAQDDKRLKVVKDRQEIADLKSKIRKKKYAGVVQVGKNLKTIGGAIGKGAAKFIGEDPKKSGKKKVKSVEDLMKELPQ